jgi:histone H3/H4
MARKKNPGAKKPGRTLGGRDTFVVASKVKSYVRSQISPLDEKPLMASSELSDALSALVEELLDKAVDRCNKNGRKVVRPVDL